MQHQPVPRASAPLYNAENKRQLEQLLQELELVCDEVHAEGSIVRYRAKRLGLFKDRHLPPEINVLSHLELLRDQKRLVIVSMSADYKEILIMLRSGLELRLAPLL